ncbi:MAG: DMT family transporter [Synergistales bacterium]|nr:DMT family transporter [Synergistales bacterium]
MKVSRQQGLGFVVFAGLLWAVLAPAGKMLIQSGVEAPTIAFFRVAVVLALAGPFLLIHRREALKVTPSQIGFLVLYGGFGMAASYVGYLMSLRWLSVPFALLLHYTFPLMTLLGAALITGERPLRHQIAAAALILSGVAFPMFASDALLSGCFSPPGLLWGLLAALAMALQSLYGRLAGKGGGMVSTTTLFFYAHLFAGLWLGLGKSIGPGWSDLALISGRQWLLIAALGVFGSLLPYAVFYLALRYVDASTASLAATVEIVGGVAMTAFLLGQIPQWAEVAGCALIIGGLLLNARVPQASRA